ncbi:MAG: endonuclease domain-containing protein, partial [Bacteroidales bacterium]|nr:endonuclease domain-containing protein [Bacteroidales bacterium]
MERICYPMSLAPGGDVRPESQYISVGHSYKKGLSETIAYSHLIGAGMDMLRDDVSVTIDGTRYEPDLVYMNESRGIYIDIEVDEPYSAKGKPTHYCREDGVPKDERRNMSFQAHGWHVLRFTEEQLFRFPEGCARMIAQLLVSLGEMDAIPQGLLHSSELEPVPQWTYEESRQMCAAR